jgi:DNA-binding NtrC family response regulator
MPKSGLKILYAEGDEKSLASSAEGMKKAGHHVTTAIGRHAVQDLLKSGQFDLVVLGSSMSRNDRHHLPYMVKKACETTRVLVMHADGGRHPVVDGIIDTGRSVEALVEKIAGMMQNAAVHA